MVYIEPHIYQTLSFSSWAKDNSRIGRFLDVAVKKINESASRMLLSDCVQIIRKEKAVGIVPVSGFKLTREQLDEFALTTKNELNRFQYLESKSTSNLLNEMHNPSQIPFCSFNGGSDVWVDVGNKLM